MARANADLPYSHVGNALQPADFIRLLRMHVYWWTMPAVTCAVIVGIYTLVTPRQWKTTQALIIRPEVASVSDERLGKFSDLSEMKTSQETVLELAKSQHVIQATLREVGPPHGYRHPDVWPTPLDVEKFRACVDMRPPGGAEFGKTEVFYLSVVDSNRDRTTALLVALCKELEHRTQELRGKSAQGMIAELERTVSMANNDLSVETNKLSAFESNIGADLAELRSLSADAGNQSEVAQELAGIETERRANEANRNGNERLLKVLVAAEKDPQQILATPNSLLVSQPSVSQLKNALVNAQLHTADLLGSRSEDHPFVIAAREAEDLIRKQLNNEIGVAIRGLQVEIDLCVDREKSLLSRKTVARERVLRLAKARAEYTNLVASVQNHSRLVEAAQKNLADARARQAAAHSASLISRVDNVEAGVRPVGPARKTIVAAGGVGGLILGLGVVFLFATPPVEAVTSSTSHGDLANFVDGPSRNREKSPTDHRTVSETITSVNGAGNDLLVGVRPRTAGGAFGMFRGLSLQEAVRKVQGRCH